MIQVLAALATYEFNIRSFHPEKTFGWSGFYFHGDDRGFSLQPSRVGKDAPVTSRIWHRFAFSTATGGVTRSETFSNPSGHGASLEAYDRPNVRPRGGVTPGRRTGTTERPTYMIRGRYGGENYLMPLAESMKDLLGFTYVPTLDVEFQIWLTVDRIAMHLDAVAYVTGDGFPNCEAFLVDPRGKAAFLGIHVRKGAPIWSLPANLSYPMIAGALRLKVDRQGNFTGQLADEIGRRRAGRRDLAYQTIDSWNQKHLASDPNRGHAMWLEDIPFIEGY
jgi:hypothetical protein